MEPFSPDLLWVVIASFIIAFVLAFGIGANDVANSFGTSVGSKVLTIQTACWLATVFEIAGAVLLGYKVSDTMRKGIIDVTLYEDSEKELILGCLSCLAASAVWLLVATFFKLPISGTHSIVGATIGFSLVCRGTDGINWESLALIVLSWFVSPVMSGAISVLLFVFIRRFILQASSPFTMGVRFLPFFYAATLAVNVFSILHDGSKLLHFDQIPLWASIVASLVVGAITAMLVQLVLVPWQKKKILENINKPDIFVEFHYGCSSGSSFESSPTSHEFEECSVIPLEKIESDVKMENDFFDVGRDEDIKNKKMNNFPTAPAPSPDITVNIAEGNNESSIMNPVNTISGDPLMHRLATIAELSTPSYGMSPNSSSVLLVKDSTAEPSMKNEANATDEPLKETEENVSQIFSFLQILTATFGSFAHGGNDVSNAVGPLIAVWLIYNEGSVMQKSEAPIYVLLYGGVGIAVGLWVWGRRVIQTIGEDLTVITPPIGFTIEIGAALTVLLASKIGIPVSTTHCKVGSVVLVGFANSSAAGVDWKLFRNIISAWITTVPITAFVSAAIMLVLEQFAI